MRFFTEKGRGGEVLLHNGWEVVCNAGIAITPPFLFVLAGA